MGSSRIRNFGSPIRARARQSFRFIPPEVYVWHEGEYIYIYIYIYRERERRERKQDESSKQRKRKRKIYIDRERVENSTRE